MSQSAVGPAPFVARAVVGIDPGAAGFAVALSLDSDEARLVRIRHRVDGGIKVVDLAPLRVALGVRAAVYLERMFPNPQLGAQTNFAMGGSAAAIASLITSFGWPLKTVTPQAWQGRVFEKEGWRDPESDRPRPSTKDRAETAYLMLFPHDPLSRGPSGKLNHNAVDALLIAAYGVLDLGRELRRWRFPERVRRCSKRKSRSLVS